MNTKRGMRFGFAAVIVLLALTVVVPAWAGTNCMKLLGEYAASFKSVCGLCDNEFYPSPPYMICPSYPGKPGNPKSNGRAIEGIFNFDGRGGFTFTGTSLGAGRDPISGAPLPPGWTIPALRTKLDCPNGSYEVDDNLTLKANFGECTTRLADGMPPVHEYTGQKIMGQIDVNGKSILLNNTEQNMETYTNPQIGENVFLYAICGVSGTATKLSGYKSGYEIRKKTND